MKMRSILILLAFLPAACNLPGPSVPLIQPTPPGTPIRITTPIPLLPPAAVPTPVAQAAPLEGTFTYTVQAGDTLPALASRFVTTPADIVQQNPFLAPPDRHTTLAVGLTLSLRPNNKPDWEKPAPILPDALFVNGPAQVGVVSLGRLIESSNGWLKTYIDRSGGNQVTGAQIVNDIVMNYSISPRLVLAILEYQLHALSDSALPQSFFIGNPDGRATSLGSQLSWAANTLNNGYYGWREGTQTQFTSPQGGKIIPFPGDNAASVALQDYFSRFLSAGDYQTALSSKGLARSYQEHFGQINWIMAESASFIPADLKQPPLRLPFQSGVKWAFTGGPHTGWGTGDPRAAIDFAPASELAGCDPSAEWVVAVADGVVARSEDGVVILDLDGDGHVQTGWTVQYLHIFAKSAPAVGTRLKTGDPLGHPSCDGGHATGRHVHISRLYNGEWIPAGGTLAFNLGGWVASQGEMEYQGNLTRGSQVVQASIYGEHFSVIMADP